MAEVIYNNVNPFLGLGPIPYVSKSEEPVYYNHRWGIADRFTLEGVITGLNCPTLSGTIWVDVNENGIIDVSDIFLDYSNTLWGPYGELLLKTELLVSGFRQQFRNFVVKDGSEVLYSGDNCLIRNIRFGSSNFVGMVPYVINLDCYREDCWSGTFGVFDPQDEYTFTQNEDCTISVTHSLSARGFNTDGDAAITNAQNFVFSRTGINLIPSPTFLQNPNNVILETFSETVNRFEGLYSIEETYRYDPHDQYINEGILNYTVAVESGVEDLQVNLNGTIQGGQNIDTTNLREKFSEINFYGLAQSGYESYSTGTLFTGVLSSNISEQLQENIISFSFIYSDRNREDPYIIDQITIKDNELAAELCLGADLSFRSDFGCWEERFDKVRSLYSTFDFKQYIDNRWAELGYTGFLDQSFKSFSSSENKGTPEISVATEYCESDVVQIPSLDRLEYNISINPSIPKFTPFPILNGSGIYCVQELGFDTRPTLTINGNALVNHCHDYSEGICDIKAFLNILSNEFLDGDSKIIESQSFTTGTLAGQKTFTFNASWSAEREDYQLPESIFRASGLTDGLFKNW